MNSDELQKVLNELEERRASLASQMDNLYRAILEAMPNEAAAWMDREVESKITENPDHVQSMGMKKLAELKLQLGKLKERLPQFVASEFKDRSRWLHHLEIKEETLLLEMSFDSIIEEYWLHHLETKEETGQRRDEERIEPYPNEAFRNVISTLGTLLDQYGLLKNDRGQYSTWKKAAEGQFRYSINPGYGMNPNSSLRQYFELVKNYGELSKQIDSTRKKLSEARAKELWNKA